MIHLKQKPISNFVIFMAHFHRRVWVGSVCKGAARVAFPPPKLGVIRTEPYGAVLVSQCSSVGVLGRLKGAMFELHAPSVDWSIESSLPCDRGIITNKRSTREVFLDNSESYVFEESLPSFLDILHCCSLFNVRVLLFPWIY